MISALQPQLGLHTKEGNDPHELAKNVMKPIHGPVPSELSICLLTTYRKWQASSYRNRARGKIL